VGVSKTTIIFKGI